jgi:hypothetical protein
MKATFFGLVTISDDNATITEQFLNLVFAICAGAFVVTMLLPHNSVIFAYFVACSADISQGIILLTLVRNKMLSWGDRMNVIQIYIKKKRVENDKLYD